MSNRTYNIGNTPPEVLWTIVRGDTAAFKVYVTDQFRDPILVSDWSIDMDFERDGQIILSLQPEADEFDEMGEFTVSIDSSESELLNTGDIFDIQLSKTDTVWTVAKGTMNVIEDVTK